MKFGLAELDPNPLIHLQCVYYKTVFNRRWKSFKEVGKKLSIPLISNLNALNDSIP